MFTATSERKAVTDDIKVRMAELFFSITTVRAYHYTVTTIKQKDKNQNHSFWTQCMFKISASGVIYSYINLHWYKQPLFADVTTLRSEFYKMHRFNNTFLINHSDWPQQQCTWTLLKIRKIDTADTFVSREINPGLYKRSSLFIKLRQIKRIREEHSILMISRMSSGKDTEYFMNKKILRICKAVKHPL